MAAMARIPSAQKMQGPLHGFRPKAFFKTAMEGRVPDTILYRKKTGFGAPLRTWMAHDGKAMIEPIMMNADANLFDAHAVQRLWQRTMRNEIDGSYTVLAVAMIHWWFEGLRTARK